MKIEEVKDFPKALLKKKSIPLYKAFIIHNEDESMDINSNIDVLAISEEAAIGSLVNELPLEEAMNLIGKTISFAIVKLKKDDLVTKDLLDQGDVYFEHNMLSITLKGKLYDVDVEDKIIQAITITVDDNTEYRICTGIKLIDA